MSKQDEYARELQLLAEKVEQEENQDISSILKANFEAVEHNMLLEEKNFSEEFKKQFLSQEYSLLEKVDLIDFWGICENNGRSNQTR